MILPDDCTKQIVALMEESGLIRPFYMFSPNARLICLDTGEVLIKREIFANSPYHESFYLYANKVDSESTQAAFTLESKNKRYRRRNRHRK